MPSCCVVVPVKRAEIAKSRLRALAGALRPDLARAFARDTVTAALACPSVAGVVAVTDDEAMTTTLSALGVAVVPDRPDAGLNPALRHGAEACAERWPGAAVAALSSDLPALRPDQLGRALAAALQTAGAGGTAFVADTAGTGTTLYLAPEGLFDPRFGKRSRAAHASAGAVEIDVDGIETVRRDVDTEVDLWDALRLGVGEQTRAMAVRLGLGMES